MRKSLISLAVFALPACGFDLALPAKPGTTGGPRVDTVSPEVAVTSLGSPLVISGARLGGVTEVRIGPLVVLRENLHVTDSEIVLNLTDDALSREVLRGIDGDALPVQVRSDQGDATALGTVRVFTSAAVIQAIAPSDVAPKGLLFLRGHGFDPDEPENNLVVLASRDAAEDCAVAGDDGDAEVECARAKIFWASEGLVIAEVPRVTPGGPVQVRYKNLAFDAIAEEAKRWEQSGRDLASFYGAPAVAGGGPPASAASLSDAAVGVVRDRDVADFTTIWRDPGVIREVTRAGLEVTIQAEGRLCYKDGLSSVADAQKVLVDGYVFNGDALKCLPAKGTNFLRVTIDAQVLANTGSHGVQVVNPFFQTPVAWVR